MAIPTPSFPLSAAALRQELNARALAFAWRHGLRHELTTGRTPSVIFGVNDDGTHGNFHPASYQLIREHPHWRRRLTKPHPGCRRALPRADWRWRELDCACSSDALLMNIFCHPATLVEPGVMALLGIEHHQQASFGVKLHVPLTNGLTDRTEVDMHVGPRTKLPSGVPAGDLPPALPSSLLPGSLFVEAKLSESNFQIAPAALVSRLQDLEQVFVLDQLPQTRAVTVAEQWDEALAATVQVQRGRDGDFAGYQLIRDAMVAWATGARFCVFTDARRPDLIEQWHDVLAAVRHAELRSRLQLLTWQELAATLPSPLQHYLSEKYGIQRADAAWH